MNERLQILLKLISAAAIIVLVWKILGKTWGIIALFVIGAIVIIGMSFSLGGPNQWEVLFGKNIYTNPLKGPR